jgi:TonB family protein
MSSICVRLLVGMVGVLTALPSVAQTDVRGLEDVLKGKQLILRSYSADKVAHYGWVDGKLVDAPASVHTLGVLVPSSVKDKGGRLLISGSRATLVRDTKGNKLGLAGKSEMEIEIDLNGAEAASVLPQLRDLLFFPDTASAIAALPPQLARSMPASVPRQVSVDPCNCTRFLRDGEWVEVPAHDPKLKQPSLIHQEQPRYDASSAGGGGSVSLMYLVNDRGEPTELWLTVSHGNGMDEAVEEAVKKYRFNPAQYDNQPVGVELGIEYSVGLTDLSHI